MRNELKLFFFAAFIATFITACGDEVGNNSNASNETSGGCSVSANQDGFYTLSCADGTEVVLHDGKDGSDGVNGTSCSVAMNRDSSLYVLICDGNIVGEISNGADGKDGANGLNGIDGKNGIDGTSCSAAISADSSSYVLVCDNKIVGQIRNGKDGVSCNVLDTAVVSDGLSGYKLVCGESLKGIVWNGTDGVDGTSCSAVENESSTGYELICNGMVIGSVRNGADGTSCTVSDTMDVAIGRTGYRLMCGTEYKGVVWNGIDGQDGVNGLDGNDGSDGISCTVAALLDGSGYKVLCGGDSAGVILNGTNGTDGRDGADGKDGQDGVNGVDGASCIVASLPDDSGFKVLCGGDSVGVVLNGVNGINGIDGRDGVDGKDGANGKDGIDGKDGTNGANGTSCTVAALSNGTGYKVLCGGDSVGVILNGTNGTDGRDGVDGKDGQNGKDGKDGVDGASCTAVALSDGTGYKVVCGGDSVGVVLHGRNVYGESSSSTSSSSSQNTSSSTSSSSVQSSSSSVSSSIPKNTWEYMNSAVSYGEFVDSRDNQVYRTVQIGSQTWMAENLNYATDNSYCYNNSADSCAKYGRLYTWEAAQSACPTGWHLPDTTEWKSLMSIVESSAGKKLKTTKGWSSGNGSDSYGFGVLPAGIRNVDGSFGSAGYYADFWSSTENDSDFAYSWLFVYYDDEDIYRDDDNKDFGDSVRCLRDSD